MIFHIIFALYHKPLSALEPRPFVILAGLSPTKNEKRNQRTTRYAFSVSFVSITVFFALYDIFLSFYLSSGRIGHCTTTCTTRIFINQSDQRCYQFDQSGAKKKSSCTITWVSRVFHLLQYFTRLPLVTPLPCCRACHFLLHVITHMPPPVTRDHAQATGYMGWLVVVIGSLVSWDSNAMWQLSNRYHPQTAEINILTFSKCDSRYKSVDVRVNSIWNSWCCEKKQKMWKCLANQADIVIINLI